VSQSDASQVDAVPAEEPGIRPLAIVNALLRGRWTVIGVATATVLASVVYALIQPSVYLSTTRFLPSKSTGMATRMAAATSGSAASLPDDGGASSDYYVDLLKSSAFLGTVVTSMFTVEGREQDLITYWEIEGDSDWERRQRACEALSQAMTVTMAKASGTAPRLLTVDVRADRPDLAAEIAQRILGCINEHNGKSRSLRAKQNLDFMTKQLGNANDELRQLTDSFAQFVARNRKIVTPALTAERDRLERSVRVQEEVVVTLTKQVELAKIEEQETRPSIEIIQPPEPPLQRISPARSRIVMVGGFLGLFLGCGIVLLRDALGRMAQNDPDAQEFRGLMASIKNDAVRLVRRPPA
jgi:uncharacterized protein involved in exopolysaccharide biosynthesis